MLQAENLTKRYEDGNLALDSLNLTINEGETFCLLGANGAGKTTTINMLFNFIQPTEGKAVVDGIDVAKSPIEARKKMAYISENVMLYGVLTAKQNLKFFADISGKSSSNIDFEILLDRVGLDVGKLNTRVKAFSKGMRQKLGLAIALMRDTPVIIMDEPTSGLDPKASKDFIDLVIDLKKHGKTMLISTHDIHRVKEIGDRAGIMKRGKMVIEKTNSEFTTESLQAMYIQCMNDE
ncbi:MAG: ABC transporter ATP-binding protein [Holophagaceae bacterium]|nr:ABC transporter ATP-binding protein [Holophagaceae bacterium]